jgi:hypothetical protein
MAEGAGTSVGRVAVLIPCCNEESWHFLTLHRAVRRGSCDDVDRGRDSSAVHACCFRGGQGRGAGRELSSA